MQKRRITCKKWNFFNYFWNGYPLRYIYHTQKRFRKGPLCTLNRKEEISFRYHWSVNTAILAIDSDVVITDIIIVILELSRKLLRLLLLILPLLLCYLSIRSYTFNLNNANVLLLLLKLLITITFFEAIINVFLSSALLILIIFNTLKRFFFLVSVLNELHCSSVPWPLPKPKTETSVTWL